MIKGLYNVMEKHYDHIKKDVDIGVRKEEDEI
jgi:hypothetical protein